MIYPLTSCFWKITELITYEKYQNRWEPLNLENELHVHKVKLKKTNKQTYLPPTKQVTKNDKSLPVLTLAHNRLQKLFLLVSESLKS